MICTTAAEGKEVSALPNNGKSPRPSRDLGGRVRLPQSRSARGRSQASACVRPSLANGRAGLRERIAWGVAGTLATLLAHGWGWL